MCGLYAVQCEIWVLCGSCAVWLCSCVCVVLFVFVGFVSDVLCVLCVLCILCVCDVGLCVVLCIVCVGLCVDFPDSLGG